VVFRTGFWGLDISVKAVNRAHSSRSIHNDLFIRAALIR
jgi:hypothetical protein